MLESILHANIHKRLHVVCFPRAFSFLLVILYTEKLRGKLQIEHFRDLIQKETFLLKQFITSADELLGWQAPYNQLGQPHDGTSMICTNLRETSALWMLECPNTQAS